MGTDQLGTEPDYLSSLAAGAVGPPGFLVAPALAIAGLDVPNHNRRGPGMSAEIARLRRVLLPPTCLAPPRCPPHEARVPHHVRPGC